jgi:hypothetical protein
MRAALRKTVISAAATLAIVGATVALPGTADARWGGHGGWHGGHWRGGGWVGVASAWALAPALRSVSPLVRAGGITAVPTAMAPTTAPMATAATV